MCKVRECGRQPPPLNVVKNGLEDFETLSLKREVNSQEARTTTGDLFTFRPA
jgi:hypothetical protein